MCIKWCCTNLSFYKYLTNFEFWKYFLRSALIGILVFFVIHPYAFFQPINFLNAQLAILGDFQGGSISLYENLNVWLSLIKGQHFLFISLIIVPINIFSSFILHWNKEKSVYFYLNIMNCFAILFIFLMLVRGNNFFHSLHYLNPLSLFLCPNFLSVSLFLINSKNKINEFIFRIIIYSFIIYSISIQYLSVKAFLDIRMNFENTFPYLTHKYIKNLTKDDQSLRIAHDHLVAPPSNLKFTCHFWNSCVGDVIYDFNPDYLIFWPDFTFANKPHGPTTKFNEYVTEKNMILIDKITIDYINIHVYKKNTIK